MHCTRNLARTVAIPIVTIIALLGIVLLPGSAAAQEPHSAPHPAHIHSGSCAELGDVVYPLTDVTSGASEATVVASPEAGTSMDMASPSSEMEMGAAHDMGTPETGMATSAADAEASPTGPFGVIVETSETTVEAALADLSAGGYAVNVHESAENIGNYIACGEIAGTTNDSGALTIKLEPLNDSGYNGTVVLQDNGDGTTTVSITLTHPDM